MAITLPFSIFTPFKGATSLSTLILNELEIMEAKVITDALTPEVYKWIGGAIASGASVFAAWYLRRRGVRRKKDIYQDELIQMSLAQTAQLAQSMKDSTEQLHCKMDELMVKIDKFQSRADRDDEIEAFKEKIMEIGYGLIASYNLNQALSGMIVQGCEAVGLIFSEVLAKGVKKADVKRIEMNALAAMRRIRETYRNHSLISEDASHDIKHRVAKPLLASLLSEILLITTGQFNGRSEEHFQESVFKFVKDFIKQSVGYATKQVPVRD